MKYFYPIVLKNKKLKPFKLSSDIIIRPITTKEREEFFGLQKVEFIFTSKFPLGHLVLQNFYSAKNKGRYPYGEILKREYSDILAANYVLVINCDNAPDILIDQINLAFILHKPTSTSAYLGFRENETDVHLHHRALVNGPFDYLDVKKNDFENIKNLLKLIKDKNNDSRFNLCTNLYARALQIMPLHGSTDFDLRFISLVSCLESLYLPEPEQELNFRLRIRIAKILDKYGYGSAKEIYEKAKDIYKARSAILHSGKTDKLNKKIFYETTEIVRKSLILYLRDPLLFSGDILDKIVLD